jgi:hypothetical protein
MFYSFKIAYLWIYYLVLRYFARYWFWAEKVGGAGGGAGMKQ